MGWDRQSKPAGPTPLRTPRHGSVSRFAGALDGGDGIPGVGREVGRKEFVGIREDDPQVAHTVDFDDDARRTEVKDMATL